MAGVNKPDKATHALRVRQVQEWLMEGHLSDDICRSCTAKWGVSHRTGYNYIKNAFERFKEVLSGEAKEKLALNIANRYRLYANLEEKNKAYGASVANQILDGIARLEGYEPNRKVDMDVTSKGKEFSGMTGLTDEQFNKLLDAARQDKVTADTGE